MRTIFLFAALVAALALVCPAPARAVELDPIGKVGGTAVTCATTATLADDTDVPDTEHRHVLICNLSGNAVVYVKSSNTVTIANGIPIRPGDCWSSGRKVAGGTRMYCISSAPSEVRVSEGGATQ